MIPFVILIDKLIITLLNCDLLIVWMLFLDNANVGEKLIGDDYYVNWWRYYMMCNRLVSCALSSLYVKSMPS